MRALGTRVFAPMSALLEDVGSMFVLTGKTLVSAIRPPYPYGN